MTRPTAGRVTPLHAFTDNRFDPSQVAFGAHLEHIEDHVTLLNNQVGLITKAVQRLLGFGVVRVVGVAAQPQDRVAAMEVGRVSTSATRSGQSSRCRTSRIGISQAARSSAMSRIGRRTPLVGSARCPKAWYRW